MLLDYQRPDFLSSGSTSGLQPDEWERAGMHSERGRESVRHITRLQAGHDLVHLRQIARIKSAIGAA